MGGAWYNEIDEYAAQWLRNLIAKGYIAPGDVDTRSIADVQASDIRGYAQCHFFAGIGGWSLALRMSSWLDSEPVWTGSCPCQPFSLAGKQKGFADDRHLWPAFKNLIGVGKPPVVFGEQVANASDWLRLVRSDMETLGYAVGAIPVQAASAGAYHLRDRYWFVADRAGEQVGSARQPRQCSDVADRDQPGSQGRAVHAERTDQRSAGTNGLADANQFGESEEREQRSGQQREAGGDTEARNWVVGADGKARRVEPGIRLLADGVSNRVAKLRAFGNAIDPRPASAFISAYMECRP